MGEEKKGTKEKMSEGEKEQTRNSERDKRTI